MKHCDPPPLFRLFLKKTIVILPLLLCLLALEGVNSSAHAAPANEPVHGCPSGYVCIYPQDAGYNSDQPSLKYYKYGTYKFHNQYGRHFVVNNQTDGAPAQLCTDWNGKQCPFLLNAGFVSSDGFDLTPINTIVLSPPNSSPPPQPQPQPPPQPKSVPVLVFKEAEIFPCVYPPSGRAAGCGSNGNLQPNNYQAYCQREGNWYHEGGWTDRKNNWWTLIQNGNGQVWVSNLDIKGAERIENVPQQGTGPGQDPAACSKNAPAGYPDGNYHP